MSAYITAFFNISIVVLKNDRRKTVSARPGTGLKQLNDQRFSGPSFVTDLARSNLIAGIEGRMYPGNLEREIVKNTRQKPAQLSRRADIALIRWP